MGVDENINNIKIGDIILSVNENKISTGNDLNKYIKESNGNEITLEIKRNGETLYLNVLPKYDEISESYKLGLFVKDSSAGVGTVTFYEKNNNYFAALGHAVTETAENYILPITSGAITSTHIYSIKKGAASSPGEIKGTVSNDIIGEIHGNTDKGIYGVYENSDIDYKEIKIASCLDIKEGKASILVTLEDNKLEEFEIEIEKVLLTSTGNKNMIIRITDENLIEKTGGIIQGMSGCPILQDEKLVGAITHVFLNDATRGYGVFIENMIFDMLSVN